MNPSARDEPFPGEKVELAGESDEFQASFRAGESLGVSRKKVLLRLLAVREAERLGIKVDATQLSKTLEAFKRQFEFSSDADLDNWLAEAGMDRPMFESFVREVALVDLLEIYFDNLILQELPLQRKAQTVYTRRQSDRWIQFNVELSRDAGGEVANAVHLFEHLWPLVAPATRPALLRCFFVTRKAPGLRLRFAGEDPESIGAPIRESLASLELEGKVARWYVVPYEPERFRFGSQGALDIVHGWFDTDSTAWLRWEPLKLRGGNKLSREVLSLVILNDLYFAVLRDEAEVWDVWCRIAALHNFPPDASARSVPAAVIADIMAHASSTECEILQSYEAANRSVSKALDEAASREDLKVGPRHLLATMTLFHWNRYGFSQEARRDMVTPMLRALDPNRPPGSGGV